VKDVFSQSGFYLKGKEGNEFIKFDGTDLSETSKSLSGFLTWGDL